MFVKNYLDFKMKHIRQYVRKIILEEQLTSGMKRKLGPDEKAHIEFTNGFYNITIRNPSKTVAEMWLSPIAEVNDEPWPTRDDCFDEYSYQYLEVGPGISRAENKYGPLLYDIAMEYANQMGMAIVPDRSGVSGPASAMWKYYYESRPDVKFIPFDNGHPCFYRKYDPDRQYLNGAYYKPNREYLDSLNVKTP